jgi:hypothetical protein
MIIRKYVLLALFALLGGIVSTQLAAAATTCEYESYMVALDRLAARGGPDTKQISVLDNQNAIDSLRRLYNKVPPISKTVEQADQLMILTAPSFYGMVYALGYKGCIVAVGRIDAIVLQQILLGKGVRGKGRS